MGDVEAEVSDGRPASSKKDSISVEQPETRVNAETSPDKIEVGNFDHQSTGSLTASASSEAAAGVLTTAILTGPIYLNVFACFGITILVYSAIHYPGLTYMSTCAGVQEGGLKRSFANLGSEDAAAQAAARRPHIKSSIAEMSPLGGEESVDVSMSPARELSQEEPLTTADLPIAGSGLSV